MEPLLRQIQERSQEAADVLIKADFKSDMEIRTLTREDLNELFPGVEHLRQRKEILRMIHMPRPISELHEELRELLRRDYNSYTQTDTGALMDHINFIRTQMNIADKLLSDNFKLLEDISSTLQDPKADKGSVSHTAGGQPQGAQVTVKYEMVVKGKTFGAHEELMKQVCADVPSGVQFVVDSQDSQIIIVFCPITSRIESDVSSAMAGIPDDKQVILVKMHHVCKPMDSLCGETMTDHRHIVLQANVFYQDQQGLLKGPQNGNAVNAIRQELLKLSN